MTSLLSAILLLLSSFTFCPHCLPSLTSPCVCLQYGFRYNEVLPAVPPTSALTTRTRTRRQPQATRLLRAEQQSQTATPTAVSRSRSVRPTCLTIFSPSPHANTDDNQNIDHDTATQPRLIIARNHLHTRLSAHTFTLVAAPLAHLTLPHGPNSTPSSTSSLTSQINESKYRQRPLHGSLCR